jgi:hypothetical protein
MGAPGHHREWYGQRKISSQGLDFDSPDDGRQCQCCLKHREMVANAGPRPGAEWDVLPPV